MKRWPFLVGSVLVLGGSVSFSLMDTKTHHLHTQLATLQAHIRYEQQAVRALHAELSYLKRPKRIRLLGQRLFPSLAPPPARHVMTLQHFLQIYRKQLS